MQNKKNLWFIVGITILNAIGMTIVLPLFPFLLEKYVANTKIAATMSLLVSIFAICQFFAAPIFGTLSDRFGKTDIAYKPFGFSYWLFIAWYRWCSLDTFFR